MLVDVWVTKPCLLLPQASHVCMCGTLLQKRLEVEHKLRQATQSFSIPELLNQILPQELDTAQTLWQT